MICWLRGAVLSSRSPRGCQARRFAEMRCRACYPPLRIGMPGTSGERALLAVLSVVGGWKIRNPKSEIRNPKFSVCGQAFCLHTMVSYAIVPLPLPIGRGVFFVMSEKRGSRCCWRSSTVEQLICNQQVAGSIPIASSIGDFDSEAGVAEWLKAADCKSAGILPTVVRTHPPAPLLAAESESRGSNSVVESRPSKPLVAGSSPVSRSRKSGENAHVAQW